MELLTRDGLERIEFHTNEYRVNFILLYPRSEMYKTSQRYIRETGRRLLTHEEQADESDRLSLEFDKKQKLDTPKIGE